jgi:hypothetical protein
VMMANERPGYRSYLLRLWRACNGDRSTWRASLEDSHTGERRGFADLERMLAFLQGQTDCDTDGTASSNEPTADGSDH